MFRTCSDYLINPAKKYVAYPLFCLSATINSAGNTVFRTISGMKYLLISLGYKEMAVTENPAVFVPAILTGVGTTIIIASTRYGAIYNQLFSPPPEPNQTEITAISCTRQSIGYGIKALGILQGVISTSFAAASYYLGAYTLDQAGVALSDIIREECCDKPAENESWKPYVITSVSLVMMAGSATLYLSYNIKKSYETAKAIATMEETADWSPITTIQKSPALKTFLVAGFTIGFSFFNGIFSTKPSLESLPFKIPSDAIEPLCLISASAFLYQSIVGEMPSIYKRLKKGIRIEIPDAKTKWCGVEFNPWKVRVYLTYAGAILDGLAQGLGNFRAPSYTAEHYHLDPRGPEFIVLGALNGLSGGAKAAIFSGLVGISDRIDDWNKLQKASKELDEKRVPLLSEMSFLAKKPSTPPVEEVQITIQSEAKTKRSGIA